MHLLAVWPLVIAATLVHCADCATAASDLPSIRMTETGLENQEWSIERYYDGANLVPAIATSRIVFVNGRVEGTPGCGSLIASYTLSATRLSVASFGLVLGGYCVDALLSQSKGITKLLSGELTIERDGQRLVLRNADGVVQVVLGP